MSVLRRGFIIAGRHLFYTLSISVIIVMLVIAGIVWLSATVAERKDDIAGWVTEQIGYEVTIGSAGLYWLDLFPKLQLDNVSILQENGRTIMLSADTLQLELDLLASIEQRSPELRAVDVIGLTTEIRRSADNRFSLAGQRLASLQFQLEDVLTRLDKITIENASISHRDAVYPLLNGEYQLANAELIREGDGWESQLTVTPPTSIASRLELDMLLTLTDETNLLSAEGELNIQGLKLAEMQSILPEQIPVEIMAGEIDVKARGSWQTDRSEAVTAIDLRGLNLQVRHSGERLPLTALQGQLQWQHDGPNWHIQGQELQIQSDDGDWPQTRFTLESHALEQWQFQGNYLQLSDLMAFARLFPELPEAVMESQAAGKIHDYRLSYDNTAGLQSFEASVDELSTAPMAAFPGVADLSFDVDWQPDMAKVELHAQDWQLFAGEWLPESLWFESASGELQFRRETHGWYASASDLRVVNDDMALFVDGSLHSADEQLLADMALQIDDLAISRWLNYVPGRVLDPAFLRWASAAFKAGTMESLALELNGDLTEFPFENETQGDFSAEMQVREATLQYAPDWPALTAMDAQITASENQLQIVPSRGQTAGFDFVEVHALIEQVFDGKPQLSVDGKLDGTTSAALAFLNNSPLNSRFGKVTDWLAAEGGSDIVLELAVPLLSPDSTQVSGSVGFDNSQISLQVATEASISQISGRLSFSNKGISADALQGQLLQRPVSVRIGPVDGRTRISASGRVPASQLGRFLEGGLPEFISGETAFDALVNVSEPSPGAFTVAVEATSDLTGLTLDLPAPLGKSADETRAFQMEMQSGNNDQLTYRARLSEIAQWVHQSGGHTRTVLALGQADEALPETGFSVRADLPALDLDSWLIWYQRQDDHASNEREDAFLPDNISAAIDTLTFQQQSFEQFDIQAERRSDHWLLDMDAKQVKGNMRLPIAAMDDIDINLERLYWQLPVREATTEPGDDSQAPEQASVWPAMNVFIGDLQVDEMKLGTLEMAASRAGPSWILDSASLKSDVLEASAEGRWQQSEADDHSRFSITLTSDDVAGLLSQLRYQPVIEARDTRVDLNIEWPADPLGFSRQLITGDMTLSTGRGQLREVEPGAAGRVFGLLSLAAIPRRLSLDFRDLFDEGLAFDSINGNLNFADGIAQTDNLRLRSQSAVINISGPVNLVDQTYDQTVKITPSVSSTLPLAGAVAGGPVGLGVGTAIMLADRLVGRIFDRDIVDFISYRYRLTGPWNEPEMQLITTNSE